MRGAPPAWVPPGVALCATSHPRLACVHQPQVTPSDPYYTSGWTWGVSGPEQGQPFGCDAAAAWKRNITGSSRVVVGVLDEGMQVRDRRGTPYHLVWCDANNTNNKRWEGGAGRAW